jgi:hypothetical protein
MDFTRQIIAEENFEPKGARKVTLEKTLGQKVRTGSRDIAVSA